MYGSVRLPESRRIDADATPSPLVRHAFRKIPEELAARLPSHVPMSVPSTSPVRTERAATASRTDVVCVRSVSACSLFPPVWTIHATCVPASATSVSPPPVLVVGMAQVARPLTCARVPLARSHTQTDRHPAPTGSTP